MFNTEFFFLFCQLHEEASTLADLRFLHVTGLSNPSSTSVVESKHELLSGVNEAKRILLSAHCVITEATKWSFHLASCPFLLLNKFSSHRKKMK